MPRNLSPVKKRVTTKPLLSLTLAIVAFAVTLPVNGQEISLKTNILYDATATINAGIEIKVSPRWSIDLSGNLNAWSFSEGRRWKHWLVQPEARYWLCDATAGHFLAVHLLTGQFNFGNIRGLSDIGGLGFRSLRDHRYQGWAAGAGVGYGYSWILSKHWSIEAEIGFGWIYARYDVFECAGCGKNIGSGHKNFFSPTKLALSIKYVF